MLLCLAPRFPKIHKLAGAIVDDSTVVHHFRSAVEPGSSVVVDFKECVTTSATFIRRSQIHLEL